MKITKYTPEDILKLVIEQAMVMGTMTQFNDALDDQSKVIQRATTLAILEPAFEYMENSGVCAMKAMVKQYKKNLNTLKKNGLLRPVDNVKEELAKIGERLKKNDEKNNNNNE